MKGVVRSWVLETVLIAYLGVAVSFDLKDRRIPNVLIAAGLIAGLLYSMTVRGQESIGFVLGNMLFPILLLYFLFLIHVLGAGDIKLFVVMSLFSDTKHLLVLIVVSFLVGGIFALVKLLTERRLVYRISVFSGYVSSCIKNRQIAPYTKTESSDLMHFSAAIFAAYIICTVTGYFLRGELYWV